MRRWIPFIAIGIVVALALLVGTSGVADDEADNPAAPPAASETPLGGNGATPPAAGQLPPEFIDCMAEQGFEIRSPDEIHSVPQQAFLACLGALHSGGGTP